jgi:hypothetical protein
MKYIHAPSLQADKPGGLESLMKADAVSMVISVVLRLLVHGGIIITKHFYFQAEVVTLKKPSWVKPFLHRSVVLQARTHGPVHY